MIGRSKYVVCKCLTVSFLLLAHCSLAAESLTEGTGLNGWPRIVGGREAVSGDWPWMSAVLTSDSASLYWGHYCGGTLIGAQWIITAAHCTYHYSSAPKSADEIQVAIGVHDLQADTAERMRVKKIIRHPQYEPTGDEYDFALLQLAEKTAYEPIPVFSGLAATGISETLSGEPATVIGWGSTTGTGASYPASLQQVEVLVVENSTCSAAYDPGAIGQSMLCAGYADGGKDSCHGDSGGPLMVNLDQQWVQAGIVSWGDGCAVPGKYGVYARTSEFVDLILTHVPDARVYPKPSLSITPRTVYFGDSDIGVRKTIDVDLTSNGTAIAEIYSVDSHTDLTNPFALDSENCSHTKMPPGTSCTITLSLLAFEQQNFRGSFLIHTNIPGEQSIAIRVYSGEPFPWPLFLSIPKGSK